MEIRVFSSPKRLAVERQNIPVAATAGPLGAQDAPSIHYTRRFAEHVRDSLSRGAGCRYARVL